MKKINPLFGNWILFKGSFGAVSGNVDIKNYFEKEKMPLSQPSIINIEDNFEIDKTNETTSPYELGKSLLFVLKKVHTFPLGTQVDDVEITSSDFISSTLNEKISSSKIVDYPELSFSCTIGTGLNKNENITYLLSYLYPVQCRPDENTVECSGKVKIDVIYIPPVNPIDFLN